MPSAQPTHGNIRHGFVYERVPHITLKSIANNAEIDVLWSIDPITFHPDLVKFASDIVEARTGIREVMPSGPMHDSAEMAQAGVPTVMMFVQSLRGLSHTRLEDTKEEHLELSVAALDGLARRTIDWVAGGGGR